MDVRHPLRSAKALFTSKWFAIGMGVAMGAWILHVAAMAMAPISVVQAVLSGGVVLLAVMAERLFGFEVGPRQWLGVGFTALGLFALVLTLPALHAARTRTSRSTGMIAFEGGLVGVGALLIMGKHIGGPAEHHGVMLGAASGVLFGVSDISIKAITGLVGHVGAVGFLTPWLIVAAAASVAAFYASARGLQDGDAVPVIATTGTAANVATIAGGIIVFGDPCPATRSASSSRSPPSRSSASPLRSPRRPSGRRRAAPAGVAPPLLDARRGGPAGSGPRVMS